MSRDDINDIRRYQGEGVYQVPDSLEPSTSVIERAREGIVRSADRIEVHPERLRDYHEMLEYKPLGQKEIKAVLENSPSLKILLTTRAVVFVVEPRAKTAAARAYSRVIMLFRKYLDENKYRHITISIKKVSEAVFTSYEEARKRAQSAPVITGGDNNMLSTLFNTAIEEGVSDIHIRYRGDTTIVLFRKNQLLQTREVLDGDVGRRLITAIFTIGQGGGSTKDFSMKQSIDTSFKYPVNASGRHMIRINSRPEERGAKVVARIRDTQDILPLARAGYEPAQLKDLKAISSKHQGLTLIVGETNSGKSTTLTTIIADIPSEYAVCEVADPIEVLLPNVDHFPVSTDDEEEMNRVQKDLVRQDPNVLVVGEIRSATTAALTSTIAYAGSLVFSTLHAPSVGSSFPRLLRFGVELDDLQAPNYLNGLVAQYLLPILCVQCRLEKMAAPMLTARENLESQFHYESIFKGEQIYFRNYSGCSACQNTGVSGITLAAEVLTMGDTIRKMVSKREWYNIEPHMEESGMYTKHSHAAKKILDGQFDPHMIESRIDPFTARHVESATSAAKASIERLKRHV